MRSFSALLMAMVTCGNIALADQRQSDGVDFLAKLAGIIKGQIDNPLISTDTPPPKCGTPVMLASFSMAQRTDDEALKNVLARPDNLPLSLGSEHFIIHYTDTGIDSVYQKGVDSDPADGVPDYVNRVSEYFEYVWETEIGAMGYSVPPTDNLRGGDNRYDVYLVHLGLGIFGYTTPEEEVDGWKANSYIEMENDFRESPRYIGNPFPAAQVTAAHEFFHAIQFGYDAYEFDFDNPDDPNSYKPWWMEASSTWMEDIIYDQVNDYVTYLQYYYKYIWMGLTTFSYSDYVRAIHPYASCVWPTYLTEKFDDPGIVKQIWENCAAIQGHNTLSAIENALGSRGTNLARAFQEFAVWNFHTGINADTINYYSEGNSFPEAETTAYISDLSTIISDTIPANIRFPEQFATNYIVIQSDPYAAGGIVVNFDGQSATAQDWSAALLGYKSFDSAWDDLEIDSETGNGGGAWSGWDSYRCIVLIPTVTSTTPNYDDFVYRANVTYDPSLIGGDVAGFDVGSPYPSPYLLNGSDVVSLPYSLDRTYSKDEMSLHIYNTAGNLVREIPGNQFLFNDRGNYNRGIQWDGKNESGKYVASGVYIFLFSAEDKSETGKIAVINKVE